MNFSTPDKIASVIENLKSAELRRTPNRALIDSLFNGAPPYTKAEAEENRIQWNVNWQEGSDMLLQGREQLENAHLTTDYAFTIKLPYAPKSKATHYAHELMNQANKLLRKSRTYFHTQRSKWGSVILHGTGAQMWEDKWCWRPHFVGIDDLLVPTDTELPLENLNHFAVRRRMTPGKLFRKTFGRPEDKRDPGWQMKTVQKVLATYKDVNQNQNAWNWSEHPEKMAELWKQNSMYYETDAVPVVWLWDFYFQEDDNPKSCWYRKILLDNDCSPGRNNNVEDPIVFLYDSKKPHADKIDEILHIQFIDGNNVPPFMYHSCRGLGLRLHDVVHALNRMRCQFMQKVYEDMMMLFRVSDPVDKSRLDKIYFGMNYGVVPDNLSFVTREQRYSPDPRLIEMQLANLKQLIGEGSSQYTQDIDTGTNKERTATEVSALLNQTTRLTSSMLNLSYLQEAFAYEEICRRLTQRDSLDWEVKKFQNDCLECGVPLKWIDSNHWEIEPVRVLGAGNTQLEQAQAQAMLNIRPMLNPQAQNEVLHDYVFAITHDPRRANRLAPMDGQPQITNTMHDTQLAFGALMAGSFVEPKVGLVPIEVCQTMLQLMAKNIQQIMSTDGVGTPQEVIGLQKSAVYTNYYIQQIAQDQTMKQVAKQFGDQLGKMMNEVKGMAQRQEEAKAKKQQDPEMMAKIQAQQMLAQQKLQMNQATAQQKLVSKQQADQQKLQSKAAADQQKIEAQRLEMELKQQQSALEQRIAALEAASEMTIERQKAEAELEIEKKKADAKIANEKKTAQAQARKAKSKPASSE